MGCYITAIKLVLPNCWQLSGCSLILKVVRGGQDRGEKTAERISLYQTWDDYHDQNNCNLQSYPDNHHSMFIQPL